MSNFPEIKINSINPEDISEIDPRTISFLTLIDGTLLTVEQTTPIKQKKIKPPPLTITKEYNFLILNKNSQINFLDKNINICLNDKSENEIDNSKKNIFDNSINNDNFNENINFLVNKDEEIENNNNNIIKDKDLSLDASNSILQLNDFNETNKTLFNIFYGFSIDKKVKRKNILQINKNNIINNKPLIIRDKLNNNRIKNQERTIPSNKNKDSATKEYFNKKNRINKNKNFRQLIEKNDNFKSIIKNTNLYRNKKLDILKLNFYENQKDSNVSMKFNKLVNKLKMNRINKTSDFKNYININGSKSGFFTIYKNTNNKRYGNKNSPYLLNNIRSSPNYSLRKSNNLN
jgi:hypothetical protein